MLEGVVSQRFGRLATTANYSSNRISIAFFTISSDAQPQHEAQDFRTQESSQGYRSRTEETRGETSFRAFSDGQSESSAL